MKTSKVKRIEEIKPWGEGDRKTFYHNLEMENGDLINIGKKSELSIGAELTYEITGEGQNEFNKAKSVNPNFQQNTTEPASGNDNLKGVKIGHAINNSVILFCSQSDEPVGSDEAKQVIKDYAKIIYEISEELNEEI